MMAHQPVDLLEVWAYGELVGAVAAHPEGGYVFEYAPQWRRGGLELSPLHMPTSRAIHHFPLLNPATYHGLPPLLADSLPDRFGNALIDAYLARQGISPRDVTPLDRLAYLANRGMGALSYRPPAGPEDDKIVAIQLADLVTSARRAIRGEIGGDDHDTADALSNLVRVGTSAGGARAKAVIAFNPDTGQIRSGQLGAPEGFEHWLCKLDGVEAANTGHDIVIGDGLAYGRIEYAYHLMALDAGVAMTECQLLPEHTRAHFLTRRFDRGAQGERIHVLTLCGLAHLDFNQAGAHDYAQYLAVVDELDLGADARAQAFTRMVFNVAGVNCDDHTKNLSFLLDRDGQWRLSPAYDVTYAYNPSGAWTSAHQMTVAGKRSDVTIGDCLELADRFAVPAPRRIIDRTVAAIEQWPTYAEQAGLDEQTADGIAHAHRQVGLRERR